MIRVGVDRPWPPNAVHELSDLLSRAHLREFHRRRRADSDDHPDLAVALDELDAWLTDPRKYDSEHANGWDSMLTDVTHALNIRGHDLTAATPTLDRLLTELRTPELGANGPARARCHELAARGRAELAAPDSAVAAFDDLLRALNRSETVTETVANRLQVFGATLRSAGRAFGGGLARTLSGVLDDSSREIALARHDLDGTSLPDDPRTENAGLPIPERLDLCRRLLQQPAIPGHHVVWVCYSNAMVRSTGWKLEAGPVTFYDGSALTSLIDDLSSDNSGIDRSHALDQLPPELKPAGDVTSPTRWRELFLPTLDGDWAAVRVDLQHGVYADPARVATEQADALIKLAGFYIGGSSWRKLWGYTHLIDDVIRQHGTFMQPRDDWRGLDWTADALSELIPDIAPHLPVDDPRLRELLDAAAVLEAHADSVDPTSILHSVRVIELLASRCSTDWDKHLWTTLAIGWARTRTLRQIYNAAEAADHDHELTEHGAVPPHSEFSTHLPGSGDRYWCHDDVALAALPGMAAALPAHHHVARRVRAVARQTKTVDAYDRWIGALLEDYQRRLQRLARCRNSLAHGGPHKSEVTATVDQFAASQARRTVSIALRAVLDGSDVTTAYHQRRADDEGWRQRIKTAPAVLDALELPPATTANAEPTVT